MNKYTQTRRNSAALPASTAYGPSAGTQLLFSFCRDLCKGSLYAKTVAPRFGAMQAHPDPGSIYLVESLGQSDSPAIAEHRKQPSELTFPPWNALERSGKPTKVLPCLFRMLRSSHRVAAVSSHPLFLLNPICSSPNSLLSLIRCVIRLVSKREKSLHMAGIR